jgi:hypothetical protein
MPLLSQTQVELIALSLLATVLLMFVCAALQPYVERFIDTVRTKTHSILKGKP